MPNVIRLVIAEDETSTRNILSQLLSLEDDIQVVGEAGTGVDALKLIRDKSPDVVLTDIGMPTMDGVQLTAELRRESPHIGVVILTIYNDDERVFSAIKAGAKGYVLKDSPPEQTIAAIRAVSRGEALIHPALVLRVLSEFQKISGQNKVNLACFHDLTEREVEILSEIGRGYRNKVIADKLFISEKTVKNHISSIFMKLEINSRAEAAILANRQGLVR